MRLLAAACLFLEIAIAVWGQAVSTSQIKGTVHDASGLAVPGASVKATQTATGAARTTVSGADGGYVLTDLPVGPYQLEVTKEGFTKYVQTGIVLQVASNPTIDVALKVGSVTEQVQVQADAAMVETQNTGVGQVIDSQRIVDLPLVGRQVQDLITFAGGATQGSDSVQLSARNYPNVQAFSVAGGMSGGITYVLDGATHNDVYTMANMPLPFPDALQEFKLQTGALPAQYGLHSAAAVNAVTKSGTNEFHGDAFEFVRNYKFNARQFFSPTIDNLKRNQFGGTLGGPIRKNKLFFFGAYQATLTRQAPNGILSFVPTPVMLQGNLAAFASTPCQARPITVRDPFTGAPLPGNQIPASELSPQALAIAGKLPPSADPCGRTTYGAIVQDNEHFGVGKVDYQLTPTHSIFVRYLGAHDAQPVPYALSGGNLLTTGVAGACVCQSSTSGYSDFD
ncbi:MAG TPA: carboxypeptidase-like regulatory domain-containing protein, partial [Bryobacteraceae bacterium]|nr:carboxypeptidase-like regulatory domain-containing protein [Bryobacteraceae bacterium]